MLVLIATTALLTAQVPVRVVAAQGQPTGADFSPTFGEIGGGTAARDGRVCFEEQDEASFEFSTWCVDPAGVASHFATEGADIGALHVTNLGDGLTGGDLIGVAANGDAWMRLSVSPDFASTHRALARKRGDDVSIVAMQDEPAPGGGVYGEIPIFFMNDAGDVTFASNGAVYRARGDTVARLFGPGDALPGGGVATAVTVSGIDADGRVYGATCSEDFSYDENSASTPPVGRCACLAMADAAEGGATEILATGAPLEEFEFTTSCSVVVAGASGTAVAAVNGYDEVEGRGRQFVLLDGGVAGVFQDVEFDSAHTMFLVGDELYFDGIIDAGAGRVLGAGRAVPGAAPVPIAFVGGPAPGGTGDTVDDIRSFAVNEAGEVGLVVTLVGGRQAVFKGPASGLVPVVRSGDAIEVAPGDTGTIQVVGTGPPIRSGQAGNRMAPDGTFLFFVLLEDGRRALAVTDLGDGGPELEVTIEVEPTNPTGAILPDEDVTLVLTVRNVGGLAATGVVATLEPGDAFAAVGPADYPAACTITREEVLAVELLTEAACDAGDLQPGEAARFELPGFFVEAGETVLTASAQDDDFNGASATLDVTVDENEADLAVTIGVLPFDVDEDGDGFADNPDDDDAIQVDVENLGPARAEDVILVITARSAGGASEIDGAEGCELRGEELRCELGALDAGATKSVIASARSSGELTVVAVVTARTDDPEPANNEATTSLQLRFTGCACVAPPSRVPLGALAVLGLGALALATPRRRRAVASR